ncbi:response regulator [Beijerinckia sp. L45]|uniref:response regulator n=1 Tax=Beijerinckia sp. L45 TaxID=1641855 RepID=UPI00131C03E7|nr:response regulator [Beijerinckia sp. L45]
MRSPHAVNILVVDDSATMRTILTTMLTQLGFTNIDEAADGKSALAMILGRSYTLIISDWNMEPMTGIELLQQVKRLQKPGFNRFIFATSERSWGHQATARVDGAEGFIVKPFKLHDLKAKIEQVLGR